MRRLLRFGLALAAMAGALLMFASAASAHAVVVKSSPADGSRLKASPASVSITFDESVGLDLGYLKVVDSSGALVSTGSATHPAGDGSTISVPLKSGLGDGSYLASYRVISADSHPVAGSIRYVVGNGVLGVGGGPSGSAPVDQTVSTSLAVSHWLSFTGVGLVGGSWLIFSLWPSGQRRRPIRRLVWTGYTFAVVGALGEFLLEGPYAAGSGLSTVGHSELLDATLHVNAGQLLSLRLVLLGILGAVLTGLFGDGLRRRFSWGPEAAAIVGVGIVITFAASGHSQSANPRWLAVLVDALHLTSMVVWLGGLVVLLVAAVTRLHPDAQYEDQQAVDDETEADHGELAAGLPIFSRVALACVATLAVTGTIQAWREIGSIDAITQTLYGKLVLIKVALFLGLVGLGYFARRAVQARGHGATMLTRLKRTLLTEVTVGALVLAATGVLIAQPPGSVALAAERGKPRTATVAVSATSTAQVEVDPGVHGDVQIAIQLSDSAKPISVTATASLPAQSLGPIAVPLQVSGPSTYSASGVLLPAGGDWQISVTVQQSEFDSTTAVATIHVY